MWDCGCHRGVIFEFGARWLLFLEKGENGCWNEGCCYHENGVKLSVKVEFEEIEKFPGRSGKVKVVAERRDCFRLVGGELIRVYTLYLCVCGLWCMTEGRGKS